MSIISDEILYQDLTKQINNIQVNYLEGQLVGNIHWVPVDTLITITGDIELPNGAFMTIFEEVVEIDRVIGDVRRPAEIVDGKITLQVRFKKTGNYTLDAKRLNKGLAAIGAPFRLEYFKIEFDIQDTL
jgi:hypothetical protein